jgi:hypothetical protein
MMTRRLAAGPRISRSPLGCTLFMLIAEPLMHVPVSREGIVAHACCVRRTRGRGRGGDVSQVLRKPEAGARSNAPADNCPKLRVPGRVWGVVWRVGACASRYP